MVRVYSNNQNQIKDFENTMDLLGINEGKFRNPATPGDTLMLHSECIQARANTWKLKTYA